MTDVAGIAPPLLEVDSVTLGYRGAPVVENVSLTVRAGEVVCLLGPNGAGKTTTLSAISGLIVPRSGDIRFDGASIRGLAADTSWRRRMTGSIAVGRVVLVTALILLVPLVANLLTDGGNWSLGDFVFAAVLLGGSGLLLELAVKKPRNVALQVVAAALGGVAIVFGESDDAPGLVLFGGLLILGTLALAVRTARRTE